MEKRPREQRRIIILGMGGTITMGRDPSGVLKPMGRLEDILFSIPWVKRPMVENPLEEQVAFRELKNLDSTNITPSHWAKLAFEIAEIHGQYDGVIVTHGTDTMPYTAGAVALVLGRQLQIPVVFTGAQLPLWAPGTDARTNLDRALETIHTACDQDICEVMIVFGNRVLRACRAIKVSEADFQAFDSPAVLPLGRITARGVEFAPHARKVQVTDRWEQREALHVYPEFDRQVLTVEVVPGLSPDLLSSLIQSWDCHGLLLKSLGAGNVPSEGKYSLLPVIREAIANKVPVLISTKFIGGKTWVCYESAKLARDAGAIHTGDLTDVMAQVKLMWALGKGIRSCGDLMREINADVVGEITPAITEPPA